jgi:intracellular multiplication protein IcmL
MASEPKKQEAKQAKTAATQSKQSAVAAVVTRNNFYKDGYRSLVRITMIQTIVIIGLVASLLLFLNFTQPRNQYFATTEDGRLVPMVALSEPNLSHPALVSWAAQASTEIMTFGFHDYRTRLQESSRHFTRRGWESFTRALQESGVIESVSTNKQVVTAIPRSAPIIRSEGIKNNRYQWEIEIPMLINFQLGATSRSNQQTIRLVIVRVPRLESPSGIGIDQWIAFQG